MHEHSSRFSAVWPFSVQAQVLGGKPDMENQGRYVR